MDSLIALSHKTEAEYRQLENDRAFIQTFHIHFPQAEPRRLTDESISKTYRIKPLVSVGDENLFGELAILRYLQKDGWEGVWVDTFHSKLWSGMPPEGNKVLPPEAKELYNKIVNNNGGKPSGFFDVFAWRNEDYIFIEYKGKGDSSNKNESKWIQAALSSGVNIDQLFFVSW